MKKRWRQLLILACCAGMLGLAVPATARAAGTATQAAGSAGAALAAVGMSEPPIGKHTIGVREVDAYEISTKEQLYWFANAVNTSEYVLDYNAVLMNDITVNTGVLDKNGNLNSGNFMEWTPIAYDYEHTYQGRFDGQGHTIRGLYYCNTEKVIHCAGLFGQVTSGLIQNVGVEDSYFRNHWGDVGGFVGRVVNEATISNCYTTAAVECFYGYKGSFLGVNENSRYTNRISGCFSAGTVNGLRNCGNFAGSETGCSFYNCYALADSNGTDNYGVVYKTLEQFKNGEVAYWASYPHIGEDSRFRQNIGTDTVPSFSGKPVYYGDGVYHNHNSGDTFCMYCDKPEVYDWTYRIRTKENLYWFAALINGTNGLKQEQNAKAVLMTDIEVDSNFVSLGNNGAFTGTFDGRGHKISGVTGSLFGSSSGTITDLALQSGMLCTTNTGTISMCSAEGEVLCDTNSNIIENSYIRYSGSGDTVLCRENTGTIKNCYSANPSGSAVISSSGTEGVQNCYCLSGSTISSVGSSEELTTTKPFASGEVAYLLNEKGASRIWYQNIDNGNTADNTPVFHGDKGALVYKTSDTSPCQGYTNHSDGIKQHDFVGDNCSYCGKVKLTEPTKGQYTMSSGTSSGIESKEVEAYEISTKGQFYWFCALVNGTDGLTQDKSANAVLKADIKVDSNYPYTSSKRYMMNEYHGLFSSEGHTISSNMSYLVLSNYGTISNSRLTSGAICDVNQEGGFVITCSSNGTKLCYINSGTIRNCYVQNQNKAELCTKNLSEGKILYCYSASRLKTATIYAENRQGGIIRNCYCLSRSKASAVGVSNTFYFDTPDPFASGEVAFLLNKGNSTYIWRQNIDNENTPDETPVLNDDSSMKVYKTASNSPCLRYTNLGKNLTMQHHYVNGTCSYCKQEIVENLTEITIQGITAKDKYYNGTTAAEFDCSNAVITGLESGDDVQVIARGTFSDKNVGTDKTVTITDIELTGKDAYKYTVADTGNQATSKAAIKQKKVNVYPSVSPKEYDGTTFAEVNLTIDTSDICSGDSIEVSGVTGTYEDASVGNDKLVTIQKENMSVTGEGSCNYYINIYFSTFKGTITKKALTVQLENKSISYGDKEPEYTLAYTGLAECDNTDEFKDNLKKDLVISCPYVQPGQQGATLDNSEIGDYTITLSGPSSDEAYNNYTLTCKDGTLTVGPKELGITWEPTVFTYNGSRQMPTAVATGMLNNDDISLTVETLSEDLISVNSVNAGTYTAKVTKITGPNADKYKLPADAAQSYEIRPATLSDKASVTLEDADTLSYTGMKQKPAVTVTLDGKTLEERIDYTVTYSNNANATTDTQKAAVTVNGRGNYSGAVSQTFDIKKKALEITAENKTIRYGEDSPSFTAKYDGFVNGESKDTAGVLDGTLTFVCDYGKAGTYVIMPKGLTSTNYDITFKPGTLTVTKAAQAPNMPKTEMAVPYATKTVEEITLPENWQWKTTVDDQTSLLEVDVPFKAVAEYVGSDKGNYETESVTITITRSAYTHEPTQPTEPTIPTQPEENTTQIENPTRPKATGTIITETKSGATYKVTGSDPKKPEVEYKAPKNKKDTKVVIPDTVTIDGVEYAVTSIAKNAFKNNKKLTKVKVGKNVTSIGESAFSGCKKLSKVELDVNLTKIGKNAFRNCTKLKAITIQSKKLNKKNVGKGAFKGISSKAVFKVPKGKLAAYKKLFRSKGLSKKARFKKC